MERSAQPESGKTGGRSAKSKREVGSFSDRSSESKSKGVSGKIRQATRSTEGRI